MGFTQHNKHPDVSWRKNHRADLLAAGMPDFLIDDERRWTYVLLHGDEELESGWNPSWITSEQADAMLRLLESHFERRAGLGLLVALEKRVQDKPHA